MTAGAAVVGNNHTKTCSKCKSAFPATLEFFPKNKESLFCQCRVCKRTSDLKSYYKRAANPEGHKRIRETRNAFYARHKNVWREKYVNPKVVRVQAKIRQKRARIATPIWVDRKALRNFYKNCPDGFVVDHVVPLRGGKVSGLHVPENLQYLTPEENSRKRNYFPYEE